MPACEQAPRSEHPALPDEHDPAARVLLVDDDPAVLSGLRRVLARRGFDVVTATNGEAALELAKAIKPDAVVLDVKLPGIDGLTVCDELRAASNMPILMLTARDTVPDRVKGLDHGADDYLIKPFDVQELLARLRALLRRSKSGWRDSYAYADLRVELPTREAFRAGEPLHLTALEHDLLVVFMSHPREALSREQLCELVWGYPFRGESNFVDVAVMDLRRKLETGGKPRLVQTLRSHGYTLRTVQA
ncbi:MAG TPA: response regulator transcription factor [Chloroflexota bacterium]|nr:response regulator transcription factor [Chloroflexota bacterium]